MMFLIAIRLLRARYARRGVAHSDDTLALCSLFRTLLEVWPSDGLAAQTSRHFLHPPASVQDRVPRSLGPIG